MSQRTLFCLLVSMLLTACTTVPTQQALPALERAQQAVTTAAADNAVQHYTAAELQKAQDTLQAAQSAWTKEHNQALAEHLAYMAQQQAEIAQAHAAEQAAVAQSKQIMKQRDTLRLHARGQELQAKKSQIEELKQQLADLKPKQTAEGIVLTLGDVLFAFDSAKLSAAADDPLDRLAAFLREHSSDRVRIEGYTDSTGSTAYNQRLSERRAQSVANAMLTRGIASDRMKVAGYGEANPVAPNSTKAGRARNRRVEFVILGAGTADTDTPGATSEPQGSSQ